MLHKRRSVQRAVQQAAKCRLPFPFSTDFESSISNSAHHPTSHRKDDTDVVFLVESTSAASPENATNFVPSRNFTTGDIQAIDSLLLGEAVPVSRLFVPSTSVDENTQPELDARASVEAPEQNRKKKVLKVFGSGTNKTNFAEMYRSRRALVQRLLQVPSCHFLPRRSLTKTTAPSGAAAVLEPEKRDEEVVAPSAEALRRKLAALEQFSRFFPSSSGGSESSAVTPTHTTSPPSQLPDRTSSSPVVSTGAPRSSTTRDAAGASFSVVSEASDPTKATLALLLEVAALRTLALRMEQEEHAKKDHTPSSCPRPSMDAVETLTAAVIHILVTKGIHLPLTVRSSTAAGTTSKAARTPTETAITGVELFEARRLVNPSEEHRRQSKSIFWHRSGPTTRVVFPPLRLPFVRGSWRHCAEVMSWARREQLREKDNHPECHRCTTHVPSTDILHLCGMLARVVGTRTRDAPTQQHKEEEEDLPSSSMALASRPQLPPPTPSAGNLLDFSADGSLASAGGRCQAQVEALETALEWLQEAREYELSDKHLFRLSRAFGTYSGAVVKGKQLRFLFKDPSYKNDHRLSLRGEPEDGTVDADKDGDGSSPLAFEDAQKLRRERGQQLLMSTSKRTAVGGDASPDAAAAAWEVPGTELVVTHQWAEALAQFSRLLVLSGALLVERPSQQEQLPPSASSVDGDAKPTQPLIDVSAADEITTVREDTYYIRSSPALRKAAQQLRPSSSAGAAPSHSKKLSKSRRFAIVRNFVREGLPIAAAAAMASGRVAIVEAFLDRFGSLLFGSAESSLHWWYQGTSECVLEYATSMLSSLLPLYTHQMIVHRFFLPSPSSVSSDSNLHQVPEQTQSSATCDDAGESSCAAQLTNALLSGHNYRTSMWVEALAAVGPADACLAALKANPNVVLSTEAAAKVALAAVLQYAAAPEVAEVCSTASQFAPNSFPSFRFAELDQVRPSSRLVMKQRSKQQLEQQSPLPSSSESGAGSSSHESSLAATQLPDSIFRVFYDMPLRSGINTTIVSRGVDVPMSSKLYTENQKKKKFGGSGGVSRRVLPTFGSLLLGRCARSAATHFPTMTDTTMFKQSSDPKSTATGEEANILKAGTVPVAVQEDAVAAVDGGDGEAVVTATVMELDLNALVQQVVTERDRAEAARRNRLEQEQDHGDRNEVGQPSSPQVVLDTAATTTTASLPSANEIVIRRGESPPSATVKDHCPDGSEQFVLLECDRRSGLALLYKPSRAHSTYTPPATAHASASTVPPRGNLVSFIASLSFSAFSASAPDLKSDDGGSSKQRAKVSSQFCVGLWDVMEEIGLCRSQLALASSPCLVAAPVALDEKELEETKTESTSTDDKVLSENEDNVSVRSYSYLKHRAMQASLYAQFGLLNRLDYATSGLVAASTSSADLLRLRAESNHHQTSKKEYLAIVKRCNSPLIQRGSAKGKHAPALGRHTRAAGSAAAAGDGTATVATMLMPSGVLGSKVTRAWDASGQHSGDSAHALSHYRVVEEFPLLGVYLVKVSLELGRRHQIRQHFAAVGHPLLNDTEYHPGAAASSSHCPSLGGSFALHAAALYYSKVVTSSASSATSTTSQSVAGSRKTTKLVTTKVACAPPRKFRVALEELRQAEVKLGKHYSTKGSGNSS